MGFGQTHRFLNQRTGQFNDPETRRKICAKVRERQCGVSSRKAARSRFAYDGGNHFHPGDAGHVDGMTRGGIGLLKDPPAALLLNVPGDRLQGETRLLAVPAKRA
jgi:hypothetical protein